MFSKYVDLESKKAISRMYYKNSFDILALDRYFSYKKRDINITLCIFKYLYKKE